MGSFGEAFRRAAKSFSDSMGPGAYQLVGKKVVCPHCGGTGFAEGSAQLNSAGMTFIGLDWANKSAATLACISCGRIEWFMQRPERVGNATSG